MEILTSDSRQFLLNDKLVYLGTPYRHSNPEVVKLRANVINAITTILITREKLNIYSPISYTELLNQTGLVLRDFSTWKRFDGFMVSRCDCLLILLINGWKESEGLRFEEDVAKRNNIPIYYLDPCEFGY